MPRKTGRRGAEAEGVTVARVRHEARTPVLRWVLAACVAGGSLPVSYTHLRAHETPEHLVCRLLLEKKKTKTKQENKGKKE